MAENVPAPQAAQVLSVSSGVFRAREALSHATAGRECGAWVGIVRGGERAGSTGRTGVVDFERSCMRREALSYATASRECGAWVRIVRGRRA